MKKKSILSITALLICFSVFAQISSGIISYKSESMHGEPGWEESLKEWRDTATSEKTLKLIEKTEKEIREFMAKHKKPDDSKPDFVFYFNSEKARMLQRFEKLDDDYRIYDINDFTHYRYRLKNEQIKIDTVIWNAEKISGWTLNYAISTDINDRKTILGFDCYKVKVEEFRQREGYTPLELIHEIYITEEIVFPPHLVCNWYRKLTDYCALEIKSWNMDSPKNYSVTSAVDFQEKPDESVFEIPEKFQKQ